MNIWNNLWRIIVALWGIGNLWARLAIIIITSWPLLITLISFIGWIPLTAIAAILPLGAIVFLLIAIIDPLVIAAIGLFWPNFLKTMALIIGTELTIGVFFTVVPIENDRGLIPVVLLIILTIIFLLLSGKNIKPIIKTLIGLLVFITIVFILGGRDEVKEYWGDAKEWMSKKAEKAASGTKETSWPTETFSLNKGDTLGTVWAENGYKYQVTANHRWLLLSGNNPGGYQMASGQECIVGTDPASVVKVVGLADGTVLKFQRRK